MRNKLDENVMDMLKELLTMPVNAVIAECLNVEVDRVHPGSELVADLGMFPGNAEAATERNSLHIRLYRNRDA